MKASWPWAALIAATACRMEPSPPPVPVEGTDEAVAAFAGEWAGDYWSKAPGRHGSIRFSLAEHADTGYGEVEITFSPSLHLSREGAAVDPKTPSDELPPPPCTVIGIAVVRIEDRLVRGTTVPYWDPDCDCRAQTVFEGKLARHRITGTFSTRRDSADRPVLSGEWRADRKR